jgi:hypothetical protein
MARGLSSNLKTEFANQSVKPIILLTIGFATPVKLTNHYKDIVSGGNTFTSSGHLLNISSKSESSEINVANFQISLSAVDNTYVAAVLNNNVSNDEVTIDVGLLNGSDALIDTFNFDKGFIVISLTLVVLQVDKQITEANRNSLVQIKVWNLQH